MPLTLLPALPPRIQKAIYTSDLKVWACVVTRYFYSQAIVISCESTDARK